MKEGPDIARLAALIGDPARANMLTALMGGGALTAKELAAEAGVAPSTASSHLAKLHDARLLTEHRQGRHRYFALEEPQVGAALEALMGLAARKGLQRARPGPRDAELRYARSCYDHLAGTLGVRIFESLQDQLGAVHEADDGSLMMTPDGAHWAAEFGIDCAALQSQRRPVCKRCLDWSQRRHHLAGGLGAAILQRVVARGWATTIPATRIIRFSRAGEQELLSAFPVSTVSEKLGACGNVTAETRA